MKRTLRDPETPISVSHTELSAEALRSLIEEFVTREGTDYGAPERSLDEKVAAVMRQLERGEAKIVFDPDSDTANIVATKPRA